MGRTEEKAEKEGTDAQDNEPCPMCFGPFQACWRKTRERGEGEREREAHQIHTSASARIPERRKREIKLSWPVTAHKGHITGVGQSRLSKMWRR